MICLWLKVRPIKSKPAVVQVLIRLMRVEVSDSGISEQTVTVTKC